MNQAKTKKGTVTNVQGESVSGRVKIKKRTQPDDDPAIIEVDDKLIGDDLFINVVQEAPKDQEIRTEAAGNNY